MVDTLLTEEQKANLINWTQNNQRPPKGEERDHALSSMRQRFIEGYFKHLGVPKGTSPSADQMQKTQEALADFDKEVQERILAGAAEGGRPSDLSKNLQEKEQKAKASVDSALTRMVDWVTGGMGWVLELLKNIPGVNSAIEGITSMITGKTPDEEKRAAGAAIKLQEKEFIIKGYTFNVEADELKVLHHELARDAKLDKAFAPANGDSVMDSVKSAPVGIPPMQGGIRGGEPTTGPEGSRPTTPPPIVGQQAAPAR